MRVAATLTVLLFAPGVAAHAASALPDESAMTAALERAPEIVAAEARVAVARNEARLRALGPYDWTLSGGGARRRVDGEGSFSDWEAGIERPVRLPGKASLDRQIAELIVEQARAALAIARREAKVAIFAAWFDCVRAEQRARRALLEREYAESVARDLESRYAAGDLSRLELALARAELASVTAETGVTAAAAVTAARLLATRLDAPSCRIDPLPAPPAPPPMAGTADREIDADAEVVLRRVAATLAQRVAARARADRLPDPTLGMRVAEERTGAERITTLNLSVPLGVRRRTAETARAAAEADAAAADLDAAISDAARRWVQLQARWVQHFAAWQSLEEAAQQAELAATLARRGFDLGETPLSDALVTRRAAVRARLAAIEAAIEAHAAAADYAAHAEAARAAADLAVD